MKSPRPVSEHHFETHDGVQLFYRHWPATAPRRGAVVMFHRGTNTPAAWPTWSTSWTCRISTSSPGTPAATATRPAPAGTQPSFGTSVRDVQTFIDHIRDHHGIAHADMAVLAQSVGAVLVSTWAHDYAPRVRCLVLASPAFQVKLYVPFARPGWPCCKSCAATSS
jgi:alpha-beta hydrolase superfamily lysophospholipase